MKRRNSFRPKENKKYIHEGDRVETEKGIGTVIKVRPFDMINVQLDTGEVIDTLQNCVKKVEE